MVHLLLFGSVSLMVFVVSVELTVLEMLFPKLVVLFLSSLVSHLLGELVKLKVSINPCLDGSRGKSLTRDTKVGIFRWSASLDESKEYG